MVQRNNINDGYLSSCIFILSRDKLIPQLIFDLYQASAVFPVYFDSSEILAKLFIGYYGGTVIMTIDNNLDIKSSNKYLLLSENEFINLLPSFNVYKNSTAYYLINQVSSSTMISLYNRIYIGKTNVNFNLNIWSTISLDQAGNYNLIFISRWTRLLWWYYIYSVYS